MNRKGFAPIVLILIFAAAVAAGAGAFYYRGKIFSPVKPAACTQEAKQCPDGSYVSRTTPNCEFAACPVETSTQEATTGWQIYRNNKYNYEIKYPKTLELWGSESNDGLKYNARFPAEPQDSVVYTEEGPFRIEAFFGTKWLEDWKASGYPSGHGELSMSFIATTTFNNYQAIRIEYCDLGGCIEQIVLVKDNVTYELNSIVLLDNYNENNKDPILLNQILSTFKFIQPVASAVGTLTGAISIGPICPVESYPPRPECVPSREAYASREFLVFSADQTKTITSFHADANGKYNVTLVPGTYVIVPAKMGMGYISKDLPKTITIIEGQTTTLNISVDTGIR